MNNRLECRKHVRCGKGYGAVRAVVMSFNRVAQDHTPHVEKPPPHPAGAFLDPKPVLRSVAGVFRRVPTATGVVSAAMLEGDAFLDRGESPEVEGTIFDSSSVRGEVAADPSRFVPGHAVIRPARSTRSPGQRASFDDEAAFAAIAVVEPL